MTDQEWAQTSDGQWVPVNNPRGGSGITSATWWVFGGLAALLALTLVAAAIGDAVWDTSPEASLQDEAVQAMDDLWAGYTPSERIDFCTEARAAGYEVVADEIGRARMLTETREVRYWLEDRCG